MTLTRSAQPAAEPAAQPTGPAPSALSADDPRRALAKAVALGGRVVAGVRTDQLELPTPCESMNVRQLVGHVIAALQRLAAVAHGDEDPFAGSSHPIVASVADERRSEAWSVAAQDVQAAWTDPALLGAMLTLPFATLPGAVVVGIYTSEVSVHTWDLAQATGQQPAWDDAVLASALAVMRIGLPAEPRGGELPFGAVVPVPADAPLIDQLVAWNGRDPRM